MFIMSPRADVLCLLAGLAFVSSAQDSASCASPGDDIFDPKFGSQTSAACCDGQSAIPCNGKQVCPVQGDCPDWTRAPTAGSGYDAVPSVTDSKPNAQEDAVGWGDQGHCAQEYDVSDIVDDEHHSDPDRWVSAHNYFRECHGSPPLEWAPELLPTAKAWVHTILQHCATGEDMKKWVDAAGPGSSRPHDPLAFVSEKPLQAENIDARMYNSIESPEWMPVQDWYEEVKTDCPGAGQLDGCGGKLNHFTTLIWREARRVACYAGIRGAFRVVSCRYAAAGDGDGCEVPNSVGPPKTKGCQLGAGVEDGLPEVPALKHHCKRFDLQSGSSESPSPDSTDSAPEVVRSNRPLLWVSQKANLSCIQKGELGKCERCIHDEQCQEGFHCCPFMKKCVNGGSMTCWTPIAFCQPPCMDTEPAHECKCNPKGSKDTYPDGWQSPTCSTGETPMIVTTTPMPVSPSILLTYQNFKGNAQWKRFQAFVRSEMGAWKVKRDCSYLKFTPNLFNRDQYWFSTGHLFLEFNDIVDLSDSAFVFEQIVPKIEQATPSNPQVATMCKNTVQEFSILPEPISASPTGRLPAMVLLVSFSLVASTAGFAVLRRRLHPAGSLLHSEESECFLDGSSPL
eukprot:TRINITY_DN42023_c0_g1_i1.p1 TRINITY_DN42023_c0_g1~~TRINITY_DN42023_c0_g1_i1.p1  ORF type:complete len:622 (-),score=81.23 TRINITY_DN42023_c0_g1_i1:366-2231(-)